MGSQERLNKKLDARERIVLFIPEYAAYMMNRLIKGLDGNVPYERIQGEKANCRGTLVWGASFLQNNA